MQPAAHGAKQDRSGDPFVALETVGRGRGEHLRFSSLGGLPSAETRQRNGVANLKGPRNETGAGTAGALTPERLR